MRPLLVVAALISNLAPVRPRCAEPDRQHHQIRAGHDACDAVLAVRLPAVDAGPFASGFLGCDWQS